MGCRMGLLGKKVGMTQRFNTKGEWIPLSVLQLGPCVVLEVKTVEKHGYAAILLGYEEKSPRLTTRPQGGLFAKVKTTPKRFLSEIRLAPDEVGQFQVGQTLSVGQVFHQGDIVDVVATSRGKGFQGVMKKYHFSGFRATHGTHEYFRHGGSIGCRLTPGHVHRGKRMPGQMGNRRVTVQNLKVVEVIAEKNLILLHGSVPGSPQAHLTLKHAIKRQHRTFHLSTEVPAAPETPAENATEAAPPA